MQGKAKTASGILNKQIPAESVMLSELVKEDPFESLFQIRPNILQAIRDDIKAKGFDQSKPVNVWSRPRQDGGRELVLIDGFTRVRACEELQLLTVTAYVQEFADRQAAVDYAIHQQRDRRNLTDAEILTIIEAIDKPVRGFKGDSSLAPDPAIEEGPQKPAERKSAKRTADAIGASLSKTEKGRAVLKDQELAQQVKSGRKRLNQAYNELRKKVLNKTQKPKESGRGVHLELSKADALEIVQALLENVTPTRRKIASSVRTSLKAASR